MSFQPRLCGKPFWIELQSDPVLCLDSVQLLKRLLCEFKSSDVNACETISVPCER